MGAEKGGKPFVSVVITCYNQARYLDDAIRSVQKQTWPYREIVVIDDGSTDHTRWVAAAYPDVRYVHQENKGLSDARNAGISESVGDYLVFLDADDLLEECALEKNLDCLERDTTVAFVAGGHIKVDKWLYPLGKQETSVPRSANHYIEFLRGNFIGMHGAVMYRRMVLDEFRFDPELQCCEDYDLYLRITRKHSISCHDELIAVYRQHSDGMSSDLCMMYEGAMRVLRKQLIALKTGAERRALAEGLRNWRAYYSERISRATRRQVRTRSYWPPLVAWLILAQNEPLSLIPTLLRNLRQVVFNYLAPAAFRHLLRRFGFLKAYVPARGRVDTGDFCRTTPFSDDFGFDRGGPVDRYYIEKFLQANSTYIRGHVLEIGDNEYTRRFGEARVQTSDILHIDKSNSRATYVGDIAHAPDLPKDRFDCIIFTQTLHLIYDIRSAMTTCYRILKPGGCLLITAPGITQIDGGPWKQYWLWSFTDTSLRAVVQESFSQSLVEVRTFGNVFAATAFLYGMGLPEMKRETLEVHDPRYQVIVAARAIKKAHLL